MKALGKLEALVSAVKKETEGINILLDVVVKQRDAVRDGNFEAMQNLMKLLHSASIEVQKHETLRDKAADALAAEFGCEKKLQALSEASKSEELRSAGEALARATNAVGAESKILTRLVNEGQKFNDMMLSELRRLGSAPGFSNATGSMDLKG